MVFFYVSKYVTKWIGPSLFRTGLLLRKRLAQAQRGTPDSVGAVPVASTNNYWMDMACLIPYSQKLLSLAVYDESKRLALEFRKQYLKEQREGSGAGDAAVATPAWRSEEAMATIAMTIDPAATRQLSGMRVKVLDEYLRSSLIPNGLWSDVERNWRYHLRIVAWARKEFLISKYGPYIQEAMVAYPELKNSPQLSGSSDSSGSRRKLLLDLVHRGVIDTDNIGGGGDPAASNNNSSTSPFLMLPSSDVIVKAFRMKGWSNDKSTERYVFVTSLEKSAVKHEHEKRRPCGLPQLTTFDSSILGIFWWCFIAESHRA